MTIQKYKFGKTRMRIQTYKEGTEVPHIMIPIMRLEGTPGRWKKIGYVENHLHRVKVDDTDYIDISVGTTVRINPKV